MLWCQIVRIFQLLIMCNIWRDLTNLLSLFLISLYLFSFFRVQLFLLVLSVLHTSCLWCAEKRLRGTKCSKFFFFFFQQGVFQRVGKPSFDGRPVFLKEEIDENIARWVEDFQMMPQKKAEVALEMWALRLVLWCRCIKSSGRCLEGVFFLGFYPHVEVTCLLFNKSHIRNQLQ